MTTPTTAPTAAETVAATLAAHPDGITTRDLADAAGVSQSATAKALTALEAAGTATRTPGETNGNRKGADVWHPAPAETAPADTTPAETDPAATDPADTAPAEAAPAAVAEVAPVSGAPVRPRKTDLKVLLMAGVLAEYPDGVTADDAIEQSGLSDTMGETILAAMEAAEAAVRKPILDDGTVLWVAVTDADLTRVDPDDAPTTTKCPTCGHLRTIRPTAPARRATNGTPRSNGNGHTVGTPNSDGSAKLGKNELRNQVEALMRDIGPGHDLTPGTVARELGRSSGACRNAMDKLTGPGVLVMTSGTPEKYALSPTAPAPAAEVLALMTRRAADAPTPSDNAASDTPAADDTDSDPGTADDAGATAEAA